MTGLLARVQLLSRLLLLRMNSRTILLFLLSNNATYRAVGVVVDPIQSVKGVAVIDCFRLINPHLLMLSQEPRQTTSNIGHLTKPAITALIHGLNKHYYSIVISYRKSDLEQRMLMGLMQTRWVQALSMTPYDAHRESQTKRVADIKSLVSSWKEEVTQQLQLDDDSFMLNRVGRSSTFQLLTLQSFFIGW